MKKIKMLKDFLKNPAGVLEEVISQNNLVGSIAFYVLFLVFVAIYSIILGVIFLYPDYSSIINVSSLSYEAIGIVLGLVSLFIFSLIVFLINLIFSKKTGYKKNSSCRF